MQVQQNKIIIIHIIIHIIHIIIFIRQETI